MSVPAPDPSDQPERSDRSHAPGIFTSIAPKYSWMGAVMSFGQDGRWRRLMVDRLGAVPGSLVLDVAAGTGLVSRELAARSLVRVVSFDMSEPMLRSGLPANRAAGLDQRIWPTLGRAERLPFPDDTFDALTFSYLLRYVDDPAATMRELARVVRPGGPIASLEFHVPDQPFLRAGWYGYTRAALPVIGSLAGTAWWRTGRFLGPSVTRFDERAPLPVQVRWWQEADITHVRSRVMSLGAGVVIWGVKGGSRGR
jgi:demethylmenaquinone methyltransferase / 2-methoxy-6-polyprenyl-1,4-benzoquinol methylase